jgi:hypothetical protein
MEVQVSKGFLVFAQNTDVDYIKQAYALALSIKYSQKIDNISLVTNSEVPEEYRDIFDHIIPIPWFKEVEDSPLKAENRWKLYHASPYEETIVLDADMLLLEDIKLWWDYCSNFDIKFCSRIINYKLETVVADTVHRKTFIANNLTNPYFALHYFKKRPAAHDFYKVLEFVINNWEYCRGTFAPNEPQNWISMDLATAIAVEISGMDDIVNDSVNPMTFVHMKPGIQNWTTAPVSWRNFVNYVLNKKGEFVVGNIKQGKVFHYVEKDFVNNRLLATLEELVNGRV